MVISQPNNFLQIVLLIPDRQLSQGISLVFASKAIELSQKVGILGVFRPSGSSICGVHFMPFFTISALIVQKLR